MRRVRLTFEGAYHHAVNRGISEKMSDFFRHLDGQYGKYYRMMDSEKGYVFKKSVESAKEIDWGKKKRSHKVMHRALVLHLFLVHLLFLVHYTPV